MIGKRVEAKTYAVIVAAGQGIRMRDAVRKQYIDLVGIPLISRTLSLFKRCDRIDRIILAVPEDDMDYCTREILSDAGNGQEIRLVSGGAKRQDSVYNSLKIIDANNGIVLIHDGVRPFLKMEHLIACINGAQKHGACILGIPAFDTVKRVNAKNEIVHTHQRDTLWLAQTPQAFELKLIKKAHEKAKQEGFTATDDASLVERLGTVVKIIPGSRSNIKITDPEDLKLARAILKSESELP